MGFVVSGSHIFTCAHAVNSALGLGKRHQDAPADSVRIELDFPISGSGEHFPLRIARVARWVPPPAQGLMSGDIAVLEILGEPLPDGVEPARLEEGNQISERAVQVFGVTPERPLGVWSQCRLENLAGGSRIQLTVALSSAFNAQPGFSGSPLVDTQSGLVLGMLAVASSEEGQRDAYAIPTLTLKEAWPALQPIPPCPYKGLEAYDQSDADSFFGRQRDITALFALVDRAPLATVVGPSGVGKSSLVHAGLIPALRSQGWLATSMRPGRRPFRRLAAVSLEAELSRNPTLEETRARAHLLLEEGIWPILGDIAYNSKQRFLVVIDQLEEIFIPETVGEPFAESLDFLRLILDNPISLRERYRVAFVLAMRADYLGRFLEAGDAERLVEAIHYVLPLRDEQQRLTIERPALNAGVDFEPGLVDLIVRDASVGVSQPLLQYLLQEMWEEQSERRLTHSAYHKLGGVSGAVVRRAENAFNRLQSMGISEDDVRKAILAMVYHGEGSAMAVRRQIDVTGSSEPGVQILEALAAERLVVIDRSSDGITTAELAHEAIIRAWPRCNQWVSDDVEFLQWRSRMEDWLRRGDLLPEKRISEAQSWMDRRGSDISHEVRELILRSQSEQQERIRALQGALDQAENMRLRAEALQLAAQAELARETRVPRKACIALAVESLQKEVTMAGDLALRRVLADARIPDYALGHGSSVRAVAWRLDGGLLATASNDGSARIFNVADGTELRRLTHGGAVLAVAWSPDGTRLATASADQSARIFTTADGTERQRLAHEDTVWTVAWSPDGRLLASASNDGSARIFDAVDGTELQDLGHEGSVWTVAWSPDGTRLATASGDQSARIFTAADGTELRRLTHGGAVLAVAWSPDGTRLATASRDAAGHIFDASYGNELHSLPHRGSVRMVAWSPDGTHLATASDDEFGRVFETTYGVEVSSLPHGNPVHVVSWSPTGAKLATCCSDASARIFAREVGAELFRLHHEGPVWDVAWHPHRPLIATASDDESARVFSATDGAELKHLSHDGGVWVVAWSPDGTRLATASDDETARVFDAIGGTELHRLLHDGSVKGVAWRQDGGLLATASNDGSARIFNVADGTEPRRLMHGGAVLAVAWSPDGTRLATASADQSARIFTTADGTELQRLAHEGSVWAVAWSPDGTRLATASADQSARIFNITNGEIYRLSHDASVRGVEWSPDGTKVATVSDDQTARIFDTTNEAEICRLPHPGSVRTVAWNPQGTRVATTSYDSLARIHVVGSFELIAQALRRMTAGLGNEDEPL